MNKNLKMFPTLAIWFICVFCWAFSAQAQALTFKPNDSKVGFVIKNAGIGVDGSLQFADCQAFFDTKKLSKSFFKVRVSVATINTQNNLRDQHLRSADYFDVANFSDISFESSKIQKDKQKWKVVGKLNLKGVVKEIEIPFELKEKDQELTFEGNLQIDRLDYGIGASSWILSDHVSIKIVAVFQKK